MDLGKSYDEVPYESAPFTQTHPDRLAVVATLFGMNPPPVEQCRVLELGCASGGNLVPMACRLPDSRFVGIDLSPRQIADGRRVVEDLGLGNLELLPLSILNFDERHGEFDYIICHGVYSWVPEPVQAKILEIVRRRLAPSGIAYVSYNTYPGWHMRGMIRDMMCYHTRGVHAPLDRVRSARALLQFLAGAAPVEQEPYTLLLQKELKVLGAESDWYIFHEQLAEINAPLYFHQFAEQVEAAGLQYLGESSVPMMTPHQLAPDVEAALRQLSPDLVHLQQYLDFIRNTQFRASLLCHKDVKLTRSPDPSVMERFLIAAPIMARAQANNLRTDAAVEFHGPNGDIWIGHPLVKAALHQLGAIWPRAVPLQELLELAQGFLGEIFRDGWNLLAGTLMEIYFNSYMVEFHVYDPGFAMHSGECPEADRLVRYQAERGPKVVSRWHRVVEVGPPGRELLRRMDGRTPRRDLREAVISAAEQGIFSIDRNGQPIRDRTELRAIIEQQFEQVVTMLARCGLLVA